MIRITHEDGTPARLFPMSESVAIEFHERYGFVSSASLSARRDLRRKSGVFAPESKAQFHVEIISREEQIEVRTSGDARAHLVDGVKWQIQARENIYFLEPAGAFKTAAPLEPVLHSNWPAIRRTLIFLVVLALFIGGISLLPKREETAAVQDVTDMAPVVLRPETPPPPKPPEQKPRATAVDPQAKARKALTQQLGFLGLVGKKDLKKAAGGLPTEAAHVTPGAGPGGDAGSGGELLAGMGRGLHKTTVGNSGVSGLGGIGTHGAGGGAGGYGDTSFGGAGGTTLSAVPLAQDAKVEDGLDRSQILATIMRYLSQVRACYEDGLKRDPSLLGQVTMNFEVSGAGTVNFARVGRSSLNDKPVEQCISTKMLYWKFPQPRNGKSVGVTYPFMLRPVKS